MTYDDKILAMLTASGAPMTSGQICNALGILREPDGHRPDDSSAALRAVASALRRLTRAGKVELVRGLGGGWRIAKAKTKTAVRNG